jgi:hypothetical protein
LRDDRWRVVVHLIIGAIALIIWILVALFWLSTIVATPL